MSTKSLPCRPTVQFACFKVQEVEVTERKEEIVYVGSEVTEMVLEG